MARILIIEAEVASLELAQRMLEHSGHRVLLVTDGRLGPAITRRARPDLIICDVRAPAPGSHDVLEQLKVDAASAHIPIVAVTGFSASPAGQLPGLAGFDGYFVRPLEPATFAAEMEAFLPARLAGG